MLQNYWQYIAKSESSKVIEVVVTGLLSRIVSTSVTRNFVALYEIEGSKHHDILYFKIRPCYLMTVRGRRGKFA